MAILPAYAEPDGLTQADISALKKQNFMRLPVEIDALRLVKDYESIPDGAWGVSHWNVHCSIDTLLLRGGDKGDVSDFNSHEVTNNPILEKLPYIAFLIEPGGPFGGAVYATLFRTKPNGMTRVHDDRAEEWQRAIRIHIPVVTNPGALLLAEGRAKHLKVGEAWTFNNQLLHSVVNGGQTRVHLIIDVNPNPKLVALMRAAIIDPGEPDPSNWERTRAHLAVKPVPLDVAKSKPLSFAEKQKHGLTTDGFATRITRMNFVGRVLRAPLRPGDIVLSVDGVTSSTQARSALDHLRFTHAPGQTVTLMILRDGRKIERQMRLWPDYYFYFRRLFVRMFKIRTARSTQNYLQ